MLVSATSAHREMPELPAWDDATLRRYASGGDSYCCYPTPGAFRSDFGEPDLEAALARSNRHGRPLALYVHLPFCRKICFYCDRSKVATKLTRLADPYISRLDREMVLARRHLDTGREIEQLYWGGGTPTFLSLDQMSDLIDRLDARFGLSGSRDRDYAIEVDPREADVFTLRHLQALGFNRLSLGVQDLDPKVQRAVNRVQPRILTEALIDEADRLGFRSLNLDLIAGLPGQTCDSFAATLEQIIAMAPPRLRVIDYVHQPQHFPVQRCIQAEALPDTAERLAILRTTVAQLTAAGYVHLGLDQFARPEDSLAIAQRQGRLARGLQGYSDRPTDDLLGLGVSAYSRIDDTYSRNPFDLAAYETALDASHLPVAQGLRLTFDDRVRRHAIERLLCDMALDLDAVGEHFDLDATRYFAEALRRLEAPLRDGLVERQGNRLLVTPLGRLRAACLAHAFDARHSPPPGEPAPSPA
ncbi:oxygen-independent coproporphyrinogen-3 oxidase [Billgrantia gudaonensis]|uniref:Coproporphyrinogen-III oxidase n=2 Tax=Billgrantia gudaonensis TaxID=376427 RepID=A0A1G8UB58_9GAMM|nr:oxygen-independent coproporphyrinogen III oxidase [Halomonas gudaonensis]SDJ51007.1 oxygen-independent coproporphyrinogen-3 oxidase [Halomonas gudaonensis]